MPVHEIPTLDEYWRTLQPHLRRYSLGEQRAAIALYRELAKGHTVDVAQLGRALGISASESHALLQRDSIKCMIYTDDRGKVLRFGGLAAEPMHHRFVVNGCELSTWCAWDSLFIPEILGRPALIASPDPETGELVRLVVTPERIASVEPSAAVISFIWPEAQAFRTSATHVMAKFCHFVYFFVSRSSGRRWVEKNPAPFCTRLTMPLLWQNASMTTISDYSCAAMPSRLLKMARNAMWTQGDLVFQAAAPSFSTRIGGLAAAGNRTTTIVP